MSWDSWTENVSKTCSYWGIFNMNLQDSEVHFCLMKSGLRCADFLCINRTSICILWTRGFQVENWKELTGRINGACSLMSLWDWCWENWDALQTECCHSAISVLSYIKMQHHEWQNALLAETLFHFHHVRVMNMTYLSLKHQIKMEMFFTSQVFFQNHVY